MKLKHASCILPLFLRLWVWQIQEHFTSTSSRQNETSIYFSCTEMVIAVGERRWQFILNTSHCRVVITVRTAPQLCCSQQVFEWKFCLSVCLRLDSRFVKYIKKWSGTVSGPGPQAWNVFSLTHYCVSSGAAGCKSHAFPLLTGNSSVLNCSACMSIRFLSFVFEGCDSARYWHIFEFNQVIYFEWNIIIITITLSILKVKPVFYCCIRFQPEFWCPMSTAKSLNGARSLILTV